MFAIIFAVHKMAYFLYHSYV